MADVVTLHRDQAVAPNQPNERLITRLEEMLERARRAEITGCAFAILEGNGGLATSWEQPGRYDNELAAAIMTLSWRYAQQMDGE